MGPVNLFLHSLFSQVYVARNGRKIASEIPTYTYRAMIETMMLNLSHETKVNQLTSDPFYKDTAGTMDLANPEAPAATVNVD